MESREEYIDDYLNDRLNNAQREMFKEQLDADPAFKQNVHLQILAQSLIESQGEINLKKKLVQHESSGVRRRRIMKILIILVVTGLLTLGFYLFHANEPVQPRNLMAEYFEPYKNPIAKRNTDDISSYWNKGSSLYATKNYTEAAVAFDRAMIEGEEPAYLISFYRAMALLSSETDGDLSQTISLLESVRNGEHDYIQQAEWYLALAYLKNNDGDKAIKLLQRIVAKDGFRANKAKELLIKLE